MAKVPIFADLFFSKFFLELTARFPAIRVLAIFGDLSGFSGDEVSIFGILSRIRSHLTSFQARGIDIFNGLASKYGAFQKRSRL